MFKNCILILLALNSTLVFSGVLINSPKESIRYWQQYRLDDDQNKNIAIAKKIYQKLTRTWRTDVRITPPALTIVNVDDAIWAASLADGNILLSEKALDFALSFGGNNKLAFVLAHELAHQQNDDFIQLKYLQLVSNQLEQQKETQNREFTADESAIINMALVGYDPFDIVNGEGFLTLWAEKIWHMVCDYSTGTSSVCLQAQHRNKKKKEKLREVAKKAVIFNLATQSFLIGDYKISRQYYIEFEKYFSGHVVLDNIGLTYVMQAIDILEHKNNGLTLALPLFINTQSAFDSGHVIKKMRGIDKTATLLSSGLSVATLLSKADDYFKHAIRLSPEYKKVYQHLTISLLLQNKTISARASLDESYKTKFPNSEMTYFLEGLIAFGEKKIQQSINSFTSFIGNDKNKVSHTLYLASYNLSLLYKKRKQYHLEAQVWEDLVEYSKINTNTALFQLAIARINPQIFPGKREMLKDENHRHLQIGDFLEDTHEVSYLYQVWINGEIIKIFGTKTGKYYTTNKQRIIHAIWQSDTNTRVSIMGIALGDSYDRPLKKLGIPQHQMLTQQGNYSNYDTYGIAFKFVDNKVAGWFRY